MISWLSIMLGSDQRLAVLRSSSSSGSLPVQAAYLRGLAAVAAAGATLHGKPLAAPTFNAASAWKLPNAPAPAELRGFQHWARLESPVPSWRPK